MIQLAVDLPYWGQSLLRVLGGIGRRAAARRHHRVPVPVQDDDASCRAVSAPWRPARTARCSCSPRSASGCRRKTSPPSAPTSASSRWRRSSCCCQHVPARRRRAVRPRRLLHQLRRRRVLHARRQLASACSASSWPAGRAPTSTRCSVACVPPASSSPTSCRWCSPWSAWSSRPASMNLQQIVVAQNTGEHLRLGRLRQPVHPHPVRRLPDLHDRRAGRAHPDAVRHADRRVRARVGLHDRVLGLPLPHLLHRRVRHRRRVRAHRLRAVPRRLGRAVQLVRLGHASTTSTTG